MVTKYISIEEFAGGGGATTGHRIAKGQSVDLAVNHSVTAVAMHAINHPETLHFCQDVWKVDPLDALAMVAKLRGWQEAFRVAVASGWFSPDCKHFSKAKGGALVDKRIRGLAYILLKWCGRGNRRADAQLGGLRRRGPACPLVLFGENVEEFKTWGPLIAKRDPATGRVLYREVRDPNTDQILIEKGKVAAPGERVPYHLQWLVPDPKRAGLYFLRFVRTLREFGGVVEWRELRACDYGAPTIRKRLYFIVRFDGEPVVWPEPTHADPASSEALSGSRLPWRTAAECLDFWLPCPSIFLTKKQAKKFNAKRPLEEATKRRIAIGAKRHVIDEREPFIICLTHQGGNRVESIREPARAVTGAHRGERALVAPLLAYAQQGGACRAANAPHHTLTASTKDQNQVLLAYLVPRYGEREGQEPRSHSAHKPAPVVVPTGNGGNLVVAHVVKMRGDNIGFSVAEPAHTLSAGGNHLGVVASFLAQQNGGEVGHQSYGHPVTQPVSTLSGKGCQQQVVALSLTKYYGVDQDPQMREPMCTMTTRDRVAVTASSLDIPPLTPQRERMARRVARFLRKHGVEFEGEYATVAGLIIYDLGMRLLTPREQFRVQGFPEDYIIDRGLKEVDGRMQVVPLTKTEQTQMCGNSVCPPVAAALIAANPPRLDRNEAAA